MSILKSLIESASSTIEFNQAKPVSIYKKQDPMFDERRLEEMRKEIEEDLVDTRIEGLSNRPKKKKKKHKTLESNTKPKIKKKTLLSEDLIPDKKSNKGLLSAICSKSESKSKLDEAIPNE